MKNKMKTVIAGVLAAALAFGAAGCGNPSNPTNVQAKEGAQAGASDAAGLTKVRVGTDTMHLAYAQVIGKQNGYYEKNGLDVEITTYAAGIETLNAIVTGAADIGAAYDYALCTRLIPASNVRVLSNFITNADGSYWFETTNPEIQSAADLAKAKIGIVKGTLGEYLIAMELQSGGLTLADADINYLSSDGEVVAAYVAKQLDTILGSKPFTEEIEKAEGRHVLNTTGEIGITSQCFIAAEDGFTKANPDAVASYLKGTQEALDFIHTNPDEAAQICADYLTVSKSDVLKSFDSFNFDVAFSAADYDHLQNIADWCVENDVLEQDTSIADYLIEEPLKKAFPEKLTWTR